MLEGRQRWKRRSEAGELAVLTGQLRRWLSIKGARSQARCLIDKGGLLDQVRQLLQSVANRHCKRRQECPGREMPTSCALPRVTIP